MPKKNTVLRKQWPRVRWETKHGRRRLVVDSRARDFPAGRREFWDTVPEAITSAEQIARQRTNDGAASFAELSPAERRDAAHALAILAGSGKNLVDAASALVRDLERAKSASIVPTVAGAIDLYLSAKRQEEARGELSRLTLRELRSKMRLIGETFGERKVTELDEAAVRDFLRKLPQRPRTKHNIKAKLGQFLNFCRREGKWIQSNPIETVKVKVKSHDVEILSLDELKRLITAAVTSEHPSVVPFIAVQLFAGLRPYEAQYLQWASIHFETAQIEIKAATSKTRETRFVPMEPLLTQALLPYRRAKGTIIGPRFRATLKEVKIAAGFGRGGRAWPVDVLRHCYGSYWLAVHRDRAHLAELMGNSLAVIKAHYRRAIPPQIAQEYWQLSFSLPQSAKIIPIQAAGHAAAPLFDCLGK